ncbi:MAG: hypothetical protein LBI74_03200, partial [Synergistaceae bacterium]|nr:hypothetical protein [Synergistaceae bacterium]
MVKKTVCKFVTAAIFAGILTVSNFKSAEAAFNTDVVGQAAVTSFSEMLGALEFPPAADDEMGVWVLTAPDGGAAFWWRKSSNDTRSYDAFLCFDAEPFINAGLDVERLPAEMKEMLGDRGKLMVGKRLSREELKYDGE